MMRLRRHNLRNNKNKHKHKHTSSRHKHNHQDQGQDHSKCWDNVHKQCNNTGKTPLAIIITTSSITSVGAGTAVGTRKETQ